MRISRGIPSIRPRGELRHPRRRVRLRRGSRRPTAIDPGDHPDANAVLIRAVRQAPSAKKNHARLIEPASPDVASIRSQHEPNQPSRTSGRRPGVLRPLRGRPRRPARHRTDARSRRRSRARPSLTTTNGWSRSNRNPTRSGPGPTPRTPTPKKSCTASRAGRSWSTNSRSS